MEPHYKRTCRALLAKHAARDEWALTLHEALLYNLAQAFHLSLGQVFALLGLLQPLVGPSAFGEARRPGLGNVAVLPHDCEWAEYKSKGSPQLVGGSNGGGQDSRVTAAVIMKRDVAR